MNDKSNSKKVNSQSITPRNITIPFPSSIPKHWLNNDPIMSHLFNSYSCILPETELYMVRIINLFKLKIFDSNLKKDMSAFCSQEGNHSSEHRRFNVLLSQNGYTKLLKFENSYSRLLKLIPKILPNVLLLSMVASGEHLLTSFSRNVLTNPNDWIINTDPVISSGMFWHFFEEIEHKALCFDVYQSVSGNNFIKKLGLYIILIGFVFVVFRIQLYLLYKDKLLFNLNFWKKNYKKFIVKNSPFYYLFKDIKEYRNKNFHPNNIDDRVLLKIWKKKLIKMNLKI